MWRAQQLPEELVVEILSRVPAKSLMRFQCVCKSWLSLIRDPSFISRHRRHSPSFLLFRLYHLSTPYLPYYSILRSIHPTLSESLPLPYSDDPGFPETRLLATCNGLLCFTESYNCSHSLFICNPSIRRVLFLPDPPPIPNRYVSTLALGFDTRNHDYKIVRLAFLCGNEIHEHPQVQVYSLASGNWRTLPSGAAPACRLNGTDGSVNAFVNGLAHWLVFRQMPDSSDFYYLILSFDFVDEVFDEIALPHRLDLDYWVTLAGGFGDKVLTLYTVDLDAWPNSHTIWVMKEYGDVRSWNKLFHFTTTDDYCLEAPSFGITIPNMEVSMPDASVTNNGQILFTPALEHLYFLDVGEKRIVDLQLQNHSWWHGLNRYYAETLDLLDYAGSDLESY